MPIGSSCGEVGGIPLSQTVSPVGGHIPVIGSTAMSTAAFFVDAASGTGPMPDVVCFELSEQVIEGSPLAVDPTASSLQVRGGGMTVSTDPHFPSVLRGLPVHPITIADRVGDGGTLAAAEGGFVAGVLEARVAEIAVMLGNPVGDSGAVGRAQRRNSGQVEFSGTATRESTQG